MAFLTSAPPSITSYKNPAKVASTANLALSGVIGSIQIDSVALSSLSTGDRILLKNQSIGSENGIYELTVSGLNYSLARSSDADTSAKLSPNSLVPVSAGALGADNIFQLTNNTINLGTDSLVFVAVDSVALASVTAEQARAIAAEALALQKSSNLSDLASVGTAKTNLSLQNVDNTSDANKPVSTDQQTALNLKANLASPTFSGTVAGITAAMVGAPAGSGTSTGTNTGDNAATSLVPSQTSQANKVLATDGSTSSWQYAGLGAGNLGTNNVFLGVAKPAGLSSGTAITVVGANLTGSALTNQSNMTLIGSGITFSAGAYDATIIGSGAKAVGGNPTGNVVIGVNANGADYNGVTIGNNAVSYQDGVGIGNSAVSGNNGTAVGRSSSGNTSGVAVGRSASNSTGQSVAIGAYTTTASQYSIAIGQAATIGSGESAIVIGYNSGKSTCSGANNTVVGADSFNGASLTTAYDNVIIGKGSGKLITVALQNIIIGNASAIGLTSGSENCIIGNHVAGNVNGTVAIGAKSSGSGVTGDSVVRIGFRGSASVNSVCIGDAANTGSGGVAVGFAANASNTNSIAIGIVASAFGATNSISIGNTARTTNSTESIAIGYLSGGDPNGIGNYNTSIGAYAGGLLGSSATRNINLGRYAGYRSVAQTDELFIDNQDRTTYANQQTKSLLYGVFNATASSQTLTVNADLKPLAYTESVTVIGTVSTTSTISILSGTVQTATLTASTACTFTMPTATAGKSFTLYLKQAVTTGLGTATFTGVKWAAAGAPTITATAGLMDILSFVADGTNWYGSYQQGYTP